MWEIIGWLGFFFSVLSLKFKAASLNSGMLERHEKQPHTARHAYDVNARAFWPLGPSEPSETHIKKNIKIIIIPSFVPSLFSPNFTPLKKTPKKLKKKKSKFGSWRVSDRVNCTWHSQSPIRFFIVFSCSGRFSSSPLSGFWSAVRCLSQFGFFGYVVRIWIFIWVFRLKLNFLLLGLGTVECSGFY